jgi:hypothetical protein
VQTNTKAELSEIPLGPMVIRRYGFFLKNSAASLKSESDKRPYTIYAYI